MQPCDQLCINLLGIIDLNAVSHHRVPFSGFCEPTLNGFALELDADVHSVGGYGKNAKFLAVAHQPNITVRGRNVYVWSEAFQLFQEFIKGLSPVRFSADEMSGDHFLIADFRRICMKDNACHGVRVTVAQPKIGFEPRHQFAVGGKALFLSEFLEISGSFPSFCFNRIQISLESHASPHLLVETIRAATIISWAA